jgi:hexosaminidase
MTFPRAIALAEVVWSPAEMRDAGGFRMRLEANLRHLDALGVNYRPLDALEAALESQDEESP